VAAGCNRLNRDTIVWPDNPQGARDIQTTLREKVKIIPLRKNPEIIAGVDASFLDDKVIGVACLYKYPEITPLEDTYAVAEITFPYIPGFLSFREGPVIIEVLKKLKIKPHVILFDGQGIAHPKGLGIASHIGVIIDIPTIGCAKSRLIGEYKHPGIKKGKASSLKYHGKVVGSVVRTRDTIRPLFVSPGHLIDLKSSVEIVLGCITKYRIPEPLRRADFLSKKIKKEKLPKTVY
jgi:deoxyribonuclease V